MDFLTIPTFLILAGALIMALNIARARSTFRSFHQLSWEDTENTKWFFRIHEVLMVFFFIGYLLVAAGIGAQVKLNSELFVGLIFFFGALFVLIGILLQAKMIRSIGKRHEDVVLAGETLEDERGKLQDANESLLKEIGERRQAEKALRTSRTFLQDLIDAIPEQIMVINLDYTIAHANRRARQAAGDERLQENPFCFGVSHQADAPCKGEEHPCPLRMVRQRGEAVTVEHVHLDACGNEMILEIIAAPVFDEGGNLVQVVESSRDITERKNAEIKLKESEEKYRKLSEVTLEGICFHDGGTIMDANDALSEMFGHSQHELAGRDAVALFIAEEDRGGVRKRIMQGYAKPFEVMAQKKDGTLFPVEIEGRNTTYGGRAVRVESVRDISDRRRDEEKMLMLQKMEAIGTLAGGIAHDFNNILSAIMGNTELSLLDLPEGSGAEKKLRRVLKASQRAKELVSQILAFSRKTEEELKPVRVSLVVKEALKLLRASIPATIEFCVTIEEEAGTVMADPTQVHQVMMNLCTNAFHAMKDTGGILEVHLAGVELNGDAARDLDLAKGPYVCLTLSDTGLGMAPETLKRIFEPYFTTKELGIGTGLGLSAVHGIVQRTGGAISVSSQPGKGTEFRVYFPEASGEASPAESAAPPVSNAGSGMILLVDDDELVAQITGEMLENFGYDVALASSGPEAIEAFGRTPDRYDLVITDMTMPKMTGEKVAVALKKIRADIPVILCTGFSEHVSAERAEQLGLDALLLKPVVMRELSRTVRDVLER